jgi:hypothetical protein
MEVPRRRLRERAPDVFLLQWRYFDTNDKTCRKRRTGDTNSYESLSASTVLLHLGDTDGNAFEFWCMSQGYDQQFP